jgi:tRNA-splicing ligase RtcB
METIRDGSVNVTLGSRHPIREWTVGVEVEDSAREQLRRVADLPFVFKHVAVMPDAHTGIGSTVGTVIPTVGAVVPACVGSDVGCGMTATKTTLSIADFPADRAEVRACLERAIPHGRTDNGGPNDRGAWGTVPDAVADHWSSLSDGYEDICESNPKLRTRQPPQKQLGTLGTGNHFIEVCADTDGAIWVMLHSGSRGVGGRIGSHFTGLAKEECARWFVDLPDPNLAYFPEGTPSFDEYLQAVRWAQQYALTNRRLMMDAALGTLERIVGRGIRSGETIDCHHNYIAREHHFGRDVLVTRKGAIRARAGDVGIIPGSMGSRSFIVRGLGNADSFCSASHGAGRRMSRTQAAKTFTVEDHAAAVAGVECRMDSSILDETPGAYKEIGAVMAAQKDIVEVVAELKQIICVKG